MPRRPKSEIEYRVYELPLDVPAIALHGPQWHISDEISSRLHFHNCAEIGICHSDEGMIVFEGGELVPFRAGDVTIIPQYVPHTTYSKQGTRSLWSYVFLDTEAFFSSEIKAKDAFSISADVAPASYIFGRILHSRVNFYANCLLEEFLEKGPDHKEVTKALCVSMYYELRRLWSGPDTKRTGKAAGSFALKPALDHIQRQYSSNLTVKELAEICCLSENHFRRLFLSICRA